MLFQGLTSCRATFKVQKRDEQIASMAMFISEGDPAPDCRGSLCSGSNCHNHKVILCSCIVAIICVLTNDAYGYIFPSLARERLRRTCALSQVPLPDSAWIILSDGGTMRRSRGHLLLGGLVCLVIATILVIVLFEPTLAQYAR